MDKNLSSGLDQENMTNNTKCIDYTINLLNIQGLTLTKATELEQRITNKKTNLICLTET